MSKQAKKSLSYLVTLVVALGAINQLRAQDTDEKAAWKADQEFKRFLSPRDLHRNDSPKEKQTLGLVAGFPMAKGAMGGFYFQNFNRHGTSLKSSVVGLYAQAQSFVKKQNGYQKIQHETQVTPLMLGVNQEILGIRVGKEILIPSIEAGGAVRSYKRSDEQTGHVGPVPYVAGNIMMRDSKGKVSMGFQWTRFIGTKDGEPSTNTLGVNVGLHGLLPIEGGK